MRVTDDIKNAIEKAADELGSQRKFSDICGIAPQNINRYLNGKVKAITSENWKMLYPHISKWLKSIPLPSDYSSSVVVTLKNLSEHYDHTTDPDEIDHWRAINEYAKLDLSKQLTTIIPHLSIGELDALLRYVKQLNDDAYTKMLSECGIRKNDQSTKKE